MALRQWQQLADGAADAAIILASEFTQLAARPWRWQAWSGTADGPPSEGKVWLVGAHGSGRTGALVAIAAAHAQVGHSTLLLQGADEQAFFAEVSRRFPSTDWAASAAAPLAALGDARGAAVARWADFLLQAANTLTSNGCLLVDDFASLPQAAQSALAQTDLPCALVLAVAEKPDRASGAVWHLPQVQAAEVLEGLRRVAHGRQWDADIAKRIAAVAGGVRSEILPLAAELMRKNALLVLPDRIEWTNEFSADLLPQIAMQRQNLRLPDSRWHAALAQAAIFGRTKMCPRPTSKFGSGYGDLWAVNGW